MSLIPTPHTPATAEQGMGGTQPTRATVYCTGNCGPEHSGKTSTGWLGMANIVYPCNNPCNKPHISLHFRAFQGILAR